MCVAVACRICRTNHIVLRIRTHIPDEDDELGEEPDDEIDQDIQMHSDDDERQDEMIKNTGDAQRIIQNRFGQSYSFYIKARDVVKYMPTQGCPGCKFATGQVSTQRGHSPECKNRMMKMMADDRDDKHRVKRWFIDKGIDIHKDKTDDGDKMDNNAEKKRSSDQDAGPAAKSQRGLGNPSSSSGLIRSRDGDGVVMEATMQHMQELMRTGTSNKKDSSSQKR